MPDGIREKRPKDDVVLFTTERARSRRYTKTGRSANLASEIATSEPPRFIEQARRAAIRRSHPFGFRRTPRHERPLRGVTEDHENET